MNIYFRPEFQRNFGTWPLKRNALRSAVETAIEVGYRSFDTAQMYANEAELGDTLASSGLERDEICVTTKVMESNYGESSFLSSVEESLKALRLDFTDVLLLHWPPFDEGTMAPTLKLLEQAERRGLAKNVGVSNFTSRMMRDAQSVIDVPVAVNQVEFHPLLNQDALLRTASETGIPLSAYCSLARGEVFRVPELAEIGTGYGKGAGQVALRWILQKGVIPITMSTNPRNIRGNFDIVDFALTGAEMRRIDELTNRNMRIVNSAVMPTAPAWD